jgi:hypothetical protein
MTRFQLWRDGIVIFLAIFGCGLWVLSLIGFNGDWVLETPAVVDGSTVHLQLGDGPRGRNARYSLRFDCGRAEGGLSRFAGQVEFRQNTALASRCDEPFRQIASTLLLSTRYRLHNERLTLTAPSGEALVFRHGPSFVSRVDALVGSQRPPS